MIQQFYLGTWLENKDSKVITIKGNKVEILRCDNKIGKVIAYVSISEIEQETATFNSFGHCTSRENKEKDLSELDLYIKIDKPVSKFEEELAKLIYKGSLGQKDAMEKAIKEAPNLIEIIKEGLKSKE